MIHSLNIRPRRQPLSSEEVGELRSLAAGHSRLAEGGTHPVAEEDHRIRLAAGEGNLAVDRNHLAVGRSSEEHQEVERTGSDHRNHPAEEERHIQERRPEDGLTSRPWCRTRDRLHQGSA